MSRFDYAPPKAIFVDVDDTLISSDGRANLPLIEYLRGRKEKGFELYLWSMAGKRHAEEAASKLEVADLFDGIMSKPGRIIDDQKWGWTRKVRILERFTPF